MKHFRTPLSKVNRIAIPVYMSSMPQIDLMFPTLSPFVLSSLPTDMAASSETANSHKDVQAYRATRDLSLSPYLLHDSKAMDDQGTSGSHRRHTVSTDHSRQPKSGIAMRRQPHRVTTCTYSIASSLG